MQWTTDVTEHAHIDEIKVPARAGNNQNYYSQIARHLDRLDKCFQFELATYVKEHHSTDEGFIEDFEEDHKPDTEKLSISEYNTPTCPLMDYFSTSSALLEGSDPAAPKPFHMFMTLTTVFHLATKPLLWLSVAEATVKYDLPDLGPTISAFLVQQNGITVSLDMIKLQIWHNLHVQQRSYHSEELEPPQTLHVNPPLTANPYGQYDSVIIGSQPDSDWPKHGLAGHSVIQL